ncbi:UDP-N-acetylmuramoylalanyl-D-glutamyl-2,6-diaminopimelate--D-alanyl-D-alanine ligase [Aestuariivirga litoralis]|uniref:UDP-N-acetylmuramoylalanyl-D-glutamyl-2, 6-diaminopimelate--D-alanyl-D-alanine ligase n=1 Tax=Aestuariivirga litoralis TaxID=2650924 RepID=UPI0018C454BA|nr:UDP-N-acetylmuramoylalanyl-D-glutamyl-2,6-diaminopimelate--D-alanyl-D-alanine ligase [Aestuariivirga litoralis]MBG1231959.1 UDP-N-acetylmuramoylalanyl-D-glutamyl-2,6-diaminopimelate--D-alanyl-D-alanine ligase [Aestuariivirga litoralis]
MAERALWTLQELVAATGGHVEGNTSASMNGVSIDSRSIAPGDIFVAIKGDTHDGHDFVPKALSAGAGIAIVSNATDEMKAAGALLVVKDDPLRGLEAMGRAARNWNKGKSIAVTGSVGKTSTKEMLRVAFAASGATHASASSFNNHWGVPLTLARLPRDTAYGIFEIGMNHAGEITPLVGMVQPHVAIITTIAASHLGHFKSLDDIAEAKSEILSGVVPGGAAVINRDSPYFDFLKDRAKINGIVHVIGFGRHEKADVRLTQLALHPTCSCISADVMGEPVTFKLGVPGEHMALNSLSVLASIKLAGADLARAALALSQAQPAKGRGGQELLQIERGDVLLLDESYNANPESMAAALNLLAVASGARKGRRIAVLGDMLELGAFSADLHKGLAPALEAARIDKLYAAGPMMQHLWDAVPEKRRAAYASTSMELVDKLSADLQAGDSLVVKGSLGSKMGPLVAALRQRFPEKMKET